MRWIQHLILLAFLVQECYSKVKEPVPTYFGRKDEKGKYIDASVNETWFEIKTVMLLSNSNQTSKATIEVKPSIVEDGHDVSVVWKGVEDPRPQDIIALYCPENAKDKDYIDYIKARVSHTYREGRGEYSVKLTNLRTNCQFRYFRVISKEHQELVATSNIVMFQGGPEAPLQVHLALTGDPTQMRVMWVSGTDETPVVKYGLDKELTSTVKGKSETYSADDFCSLEGKFIDPGYVHDVLLTDLKPSTVYYYSCGVPGHMNEVRSFKTAPPVGSDGSFKFITYGDMGIIDDAPRTAKNVLKDVQNGYEFIFHNGDISYARSFEYVWDQWFSLIQPYASIVPYTLHEKPSIPS